MEPFPSPTTASSAGCIPSPNSPPDSATVAASQNTEMIAMRDIEGGHKQSMISVITYPHHSRLAFIRDFPPSADLLGTLYFLMSYVFFFS